jgi:hypothetical protein
MCKFHVRVLTFALLLALGVAWLVVMSRPKLPDGLSSEDRSAILRLVRKELSNRRASVLPDLSRGSVEHLPRSAYRRISGGIESVRFSTNYGAVFVSAADPRGLLIYECRKQTNGWAIVGKAEYVGY